jgi:glycosyltransferase involved in cell wall biosynthesis
MDSDKPLIISYSGSLDAYDPDKKRNSVLSGILQWVWTYKHNTVDPSTRSAFYLIGAVKLLKEIHQVTPAQLKIRIWGNIHPLNKKQALQAGVEAYFDFGSYLSKPESLKRIAESDILFLPLEKSNVQGQGTLFIPGKLFEYLNTSKPILALSEASDCRTIIEHSGLGIIAKPDDPQHVADVLLPFIHNRSLLQQIRPDRTFIESFSFRNKTAELSEIFKSFGNKQGH